MQGRFTKRRLGAFLCALAFAAAARAEEWPQWRGPTGQGISSETGIATEWGQENNVAWRTPIPGVGHSSPIVWGGRVFLTNAEEGGLSRGAVALDAKSGKILWRTEVVRTRALEEMNSQNNPASSTPATDGKAIYTSFLADGRAHIAALDFDGKKIWETALLEYKSEHGYAHSPAISGGALYFSFDQWGEAAVVALDAATGKLKWRYDLDKEWCSNVPPLLIDSGGKRQLLTTGNNLTRSLDPATGGVLWTASGPTSYCAAGLAFGEDIVLAHGGYPDRRALALRTAGGTGAPAGSMTWEKKRGTTYVPSPIYVGGHFYSVTDDGIGMCFEAKTGEVKWQERVGGHYRASLVAAEGNLYSSNDTGETTVFKADPAGFRPVAKNMLDELIYASPAISGGALFIRTESQLYCIRAGAAGGAKPEAAGE